MGKVGSSGAFVKADLKVEGRRLKEPESLWVHVSVTWSVQQLGILEGIRGIDLNIRGCRTC